MLREQRFMKYADYLDFELSQCREEGKDMTAYVDQVKSIMGMDKEDSRREEEAIKFLDMTINLPIKEGYPFNEPSDLETIKKNSKNDVKKEIVLADKDVLYDKVYGAWLARCAGCLLGQPIEGWNKDRIVGLLKDTDNYPVKNYISSDIDQKLIEKYEILPKGSSRHDGILKRWINNVSHMPEDDDTNYTIVGLKVLEQHGRDFTADELAETWMFSLPILHTSTAERVTYKNLLNNVYPPQVASYRNIYREWIGAQIRGDIFGYVNLGNPEAAADMAYKDASISHVKNGIYGEMFIAAMNARAAVSDDIRDIIHAGLSQVPSLSRLYHGVIDAMNWYDSGMTIDEAIDKIHDLYDEEFKHDWAHTISNAQIVVLSLLYGKGNLDETLSFSIIVGFDTDCNAATAGSIIGMMIGAGAIDSKWTDPLKDTIDSAVDGYRQMKISNLAKRTLALLDL